MLGGVIIRYSYDFNKTKAELDLRLKNNHKIHKTLYKFKSVSSELEFKRIIDIINNHEIYIPNKIQVNDPFEGSIIQTHFGNMGNWYYIASRTLSYQARSFLDKYRFLSLSDKATSAQMWAYYADTFKGLCLVFNTTKSFKNYEDILYLDEKTRENICEIIENPDDDELNLITKYNLLLKSDDWQKEHEVRIIVDSDQKFIHFDNNELVAIILGHNIDENFEKSIIVAAKDNNIEIYKTYLDNLKLKIDILPYDFNFNEIIGAGGDYEEELEKWRNNTHKKGLYSLDINGQML